MKPNDSLQEIKTTLEQIRAERFPNISSSVIEEIIDIQFNNQEVERRVNGRSETNQAIRKYIDSVCKEG